LVPIEQSPCPKRVPSEHGEITYALREKTLIAIHGCHSGFVIRGNKEVTCSSDGSWKGFIPSCGEYYCKVY